MRLEHRRTIDRELTSLLREMRWEADITQNELADRLGWKRGARSSISHYEIAGKFGHRVPGWHLFGRWAQACGFRARLVITKIEDDRQWVVDLAPRES